MLTSTFADKAPRSQRTSHLAIFKFKTIFSMQFFNSRLDILAIFGKFSWWIWVILVRLHREFAWARSGTRKYFVFLGNFLLNSPFLIRIELNIGELSWLNPCSDCAHFWSTTFLSSLGPRDSQFCDSMCGSHDWVLGLYFQFWFPILIWALLCLFLHFCHVVDSLALFKGPSEGKSTVVEVRVRFGLKVGYGFSFLELASMALIYIE